MSDFYEAARVGLFGMLNRTTDEQDRGTLIRALNALAIAARNEEAPSEDRASRATGLASTGGL